MKESLVDFKKIFLKYKSYLKNWDYENDKRLVICFAGVPASGKSVISKELESIYKGIRINSIDVYNLFEEYRGERFYKGFIQEKRAFIYWVMDNVYAQSPNKLIILDKNIDRSYDDVFLCCEKNSAQMFVVSLEASRDTLVKRLIDREGDNAKGYINDLDRWIGEHEQFKKKYRYDLIIDTETSNKINAVKKIIEHVSQSC